MSYVLIPSEDKCVLDFPVNVLEILLPQKQHDSSEGRGQARVAWRAAHCHNGRAAGQARASRGTGTLQAGSSSWMSLLILHLR